MLQIAEILTGFEFIGFVWIMSFWTQKETSGVCALCGKWQKSRKIGAAALTTREGLTSQKNNAKLTLSPRGWKRFGQMLLKL